MKKFLLAFLLSAFSLVSADAAVTVSSCSFANPGADKILYYNNGASKCTSLNIGTNLAITTGTLNATVPTAVTGSSDNSLTISGSDAIINVGHSNIWTASQTFRAGTTASGTSPFYLQSGSLKTTPETGAVEFLTDKPYFTITTGAARKGFVLEDNALTATRVPFATTNGRMTDSASIFINGGGTVFNTQSLTVNALTSGRIPFATTGGTFTDNGSLLFNGTGSLTLGLASTGNGVINIKGTTSGTITTQPQNAAGTYNWNWPTTAGTAGQPLLSQGGLTNAMTFGTLGIAGGGTGATSFSGGSNGVAYLTSGGVLNNTTGGPSGTVLVGIGSGAPGFTSSPTGLSSLSAATLAGTTSITTPIVIYTAGSGGSTDGESWNDTTQKQHAFFEAGIKQFSSNSIFVQTTDTTITNTTTETSVIGTGIGSVTLPASFFTPGKTLRISGGGVFSSGLTAGNFTFKVKYGATVLATAVITNALNSASNDAFQFSTTITCRTTGATGTVEADGNVSYDNAVGGLARGFGALNNAGAATTINTTTSSAVDFTLTFATASTSNILKTTNVRVEVLN